MENSCKAIEKKKWKCATAVQEEEARGKSDIEKIWFDCHVPGLNRITEDNKYTINLQCPRIPKIMAETFTRVDNWKSTA